MNKKLLGILSAVVLFNTACSPKQDDPSNNATQSSAVASETTVVPTSAAVTSAEASSLPSSELLNTYWKLIFLNDKEIVVSDNQREPHIVLNTENRISGSDGCNRLMGSYTLEGDKITLGELAGTKMACIEGAEQSQAFNEALTKVAAYSLHSDQLELRDATGLVIARFRAVALP